MYFTIVFHVVFVVATIYSLVVSRVKSVSKLLFLIGLETLHLSNNGFFFFQFYKRLEIDYLYALMTLSFMYFILDLLLIFIMVDVWTFFFCFIILFCFNLGVTVFHSYQLDNDKKEREPLPTAFVTYMGEDFAL